MAIGSFRSRALKRLWERGDPRGIRPDWRDRVEMVLDALDAATAPEDLRLLQIGFHAMRGDRAGTFSVTVSRNWRITFMWDGENAIHVDLEDYHGD
jgi:proteic killer suppression protein